MPMRRLLLAATALLLALPATAAIHFVPGATTADVTGDQPTRALATWQLESGVLVLDRGDQAATLPRHATDITPRNATSEFFLVGGRHEHDHTALTRLGHVHLAAGGVSLVEVDRANLEAFLAAGHCLQYLDRSPRAAPAGRTATPTARTVDPALKTSYLDALDQATFDQTIREISGDLAFWHEGQPHLVTTRYYSTFGNDLVTEYLAQQLASFGYTVELDTFTAWGQICRNVVATLPGTVTPEEIVVVGGHFDSTSGDASNLAPGAEDNASGTSLVMELARASAGREFERTVQFVLFDAEEIGLRGSQHFVDEALDEGRDLVAAITADMVSYHDRNYGVVIEGQTAWEWLMTTMEDNVTGYTDIMSEKTYHSWGSDHVPFQQAGIAAFLAIDMDWSEYPYYHSTNDTWGAIEATSGLGLQIARAAAGTLADVAGLVGAATAVEEVPEAYAATLNAYPNPFNPRVTISFAVSAPTVGELAVFDVTGRKVRTLASGVFLAGEQDVVWDGVDARGRAVPSGVYLVRLDAGSDAGVSRKVQLVR